MRFQSDVPQPKSAAPLYPAQTDPWQLVPVAQPPLGFAGLSPEDQADINETLAAYCHSFDPAPLPINPGPATKADSGDRPLSELPTGIFVPPSEVLVRFARQKLANLRHQPDLNSEPRTRPWNEG
ncbi:hypothetical protein IPJ72_06595 [Candidatus Peregrinibacteria bacterium]|nr:MAG: hypothetical protein IPJ72_06595 [Candidatus Peregrinibacteria bacterium]